MSLAGSMHLLVAHVTACGACKSGGRGGEHIAGLLYNIGTGHSIVTTVMRVVCAACQFVDAAVPWVREILLRLVLGRERWVRPHLLETRTKFIHFCARREPLTSKGCSRNFFAVASDEIARLLRVSLPMPSLTSHDRAD